MHNYNLHKLSIGAVERPVAVQHDLARRPRVVLGLVARQVRVLHRVLVEVVHRAAGVLDVFAADDGDLEVLVLLPPLAGDAVLAGGGDELRFEAGPTADADVVLQALARP